MTSLEAMGFAVLWILAIGLGLLLALLYRQVEKAYTEGLSRESVGLLPGVTAPDIEVVTDSEPDGIGPLILPEEGLSILLFLTTTCASCLSLMRDISSGRALGFEGQIVAVISGDGWGEYARLERPWLSAYWAAAPADVARDYGITSTPLACVIRGRIVLATGVVSEASQIEMLVHEAEESAQNVRSDLNAVQFGDSRVIAAD
jgi:hypothetical protein